jgi:regulator of sigma E protease
MDVLLSILAFGIVLGIIVLVHEFGHYIAARLMGVRVEVFSFGFGKRLFGKQVGETDFRLSLIPLGGFVKMSGEEDYESDPRNLKPYDFLAKNRGQKIFILVMGPFMNLILAFVIFTIINITGVQIEKYKMDPPIIGHVLKDSPAEKAGIRKGDKILKIDGREIDTWQNLALMIGSNPNETLRVVYERDGKQKSTSLDVKPVTQYHLGDAGLYWDDRTIVTSVNENSPAFNAGMKKDDFIVAIDEKPIPYFEINDIIAPSIDKPLKFQVEREGKKLEMMITPKEEIEEGKKRGMIGISMTLYTPTIKVHYGLWSAMMKSKSDIGDLTFYIFTAFKKMIVGKISAKQLSGPIEIARFSQKAMEQGPSNLFMLIAFISLQLGIVNLLPIPALDGGHLLIYSIETIIRKDFSAKVKTILLNTGFFVLISLMVFVVLNDIAKILPNGWSTFWPF